MAGTGVDSTIIIATKNVIAICFVDILVLIRVIWVAVLHARLKAAKLDVAIQLAPGCAVKW